MKRARPSLTIIHLGRRLFEFSLLAVSYNSPHRHEVGSIQPKHLAGKVSKPCARQFQRDTQKFCYPAHRFSSFDRYLIVVAGRHRRRVYSQSRSILNGFLCTAAKIRKQADAQTLRFATLVLSDAARTTLARLAPSYKARAILLRGGDVNQIFDNYRKIVSANAARLSLSH